MKNLKKDENKNVHYIAWHSRLKAWFNFCLNTTLRNFIFKINKTSSTKLMIATKIGYFCSCFYQTQSVEILKQIVLTSSLLGVTDTRWELITEHGAGQRLSELLISSWNISEPECLSVCLSRHLQGRELDSHAVLKVMVDRPGEEQVGVQSVDKWDWHVPGRYRGLMDWVRWSRRAPSSRRCLQPTGSSATGSMTSA